MIFSSSEGWPAKGPRRSVSRAPLVSSPKHEDEQQQDDAGHRPGVLVGAQQEVVAQADGDDGGDAEREADPEQLQRHERQLERPDALDHEILRQPAHEQDREAHQQPDDGQQDLVAAPPVHGSAPGGRPRAWPRSTSRARASPSVGRSACVEARPTQPTARTSADEQRAGAPRGRASAGGLAAERPPASGHRAEHRRSSSARAVEPEPHVADLELVAPGHRRWRQRAAGRRGASRCVLPRSSTYQLRPRKVRAAWRPEANVSSSTMVLLTSRPMVLAAASGNDRARAAGSRPARPPRRAGRAAGRRPRWPRAGPAAACARTTTRKAYRPPRKASRRTHRVRSSGSIRVSRARGGATSSRASARRPVRGPPRSRAGRAGSCRWRCARSR